MKSLRLSAFCCLTVILASLAACNPHPPTNQPGAAASPAAGSGNNTPASRSSDEVALLDAAIKGDTAKAKALLDSGVTPNSRDGDGRTPLTEAAYYGHIEIFKLLLNKDGDLWTKKGDGQTPITMAAGHPELVQLIKTNMDMIDAARAGDNKTVLVLMEKGAYVNVRDADGRNALTEAAWNNHPETVRLLLDKGANPNAKKNDGASPLSIATGRGNKEIEELLKKAGAK